MKKKALPFYTIVPVCRVSHEERGRVRCEGDCGFIHLPWAFDGIGAAYFLMGGVVVGRGGGGLFRRTLSHLVRRHLTPLSSSLCLIYIHLHHCVASPLPPHLVPCRSRLTYLLSLSRVFAKGSHLFARSRRSLY